eukprot:6984722-Pyramimonas_sp.AAC.1
MRSLTVVASCRLSLLAMFSGRVSPRSKKSPASASVPDGVFGRNAIRLLLEAPSGESPSRKAPNAGPSPPAAKP